MFSREQLGLQTQVLQTVMNDHHTREENAAAYDSCAKDYDKALPWYACYHLLTKAVDRTYPDRKDIHILDLGAGTGRAGQLLYQAGYHHLDALDQSKGMLEEARKKKIYSQYFCEAVGSNRLPIDDDTYDVIVGQGIISPGLAEEDCFEELQRIIKPGGHIVLSNRAEYVTRTPNLEQEMKQHEDEGKWRVVSRKVFDGFDDSNAQGILHILQVN